MRVSLLAVAVVAGWAPVGAWAWADQGHQIIALVAEQLLDPAVRARVTTLLAADDSGLTNDTSMANESTWADKYRESDRRGAGTRYESTREWHFIDMQIDAPDMNAACFNFPPLAAGVPASEGAAQDCIVNKIQQFADELRAADTAEPERLRALQFLLHLVGDIHQPLHASDNHDRGGNDKWIVSPAPRRADLHYYWDTYLVRQLGPDSSDIARLLLAKLTAAQRRGWAGGTPRDWAMETFAVGQQQAFGQLPAPGADGTYVLSASYVSDSVEVVKTQLTRAGVRLAALLNQSLGAPRR